MSAEYYHLAPVILSDDLFFTYRPDCEVSGSFPTRQAAYIAAEQNMMKAIGTFLLPTTVTGTYTPTSNPLVLEWDRVSKINSVKVLSRDGGCDCDLTEEEACALIRDSYGYIDVVRTQVLAASRCGCGAGGGLNPYQIQVAFTAGLPTGTAANDASLHIGLAMAAELELKHIVDPGALEGGPGDAGVQSYGTKGYSETRVKLKNTPFGTSAIANHIYNRISHLRRKRALRF